MDVKSIPPDLCLKIDSKNSGENNSDMSELYAGGANNMDEMKRYVYS